MPKGRPKKVIDSVPVESVVNVEDQKPVETLSETVDASVKEDVVVLKDVNGNVEPLGPGQKYFECPDGRILIGDATKDVLLDKVTGMLINPKR